MDMQRVRQHIEGKTPAVADLDCLEILARDPGNVEAEFARAAIAFRRGDLELALAQIDKVLGAEPDVLPALSLGARILFDTGRIPRGLELARRALALQPNEIALIRMVATGLLALQKPYEALEAFDALIALEPNQAFFHFGKASAYLQLGSTFDAVESLRKGLEFSPDKAELAKLASLESALGRPKLALEAALRVLEEEPKNLTGNLLAARSLTELGLIEQAEPYWEAARAADSAPWQIDRQQASALSMCGRFRESESCLERSIAAAPRQGGAYQLLFSGRKVTEDDRELIKRIEAFERALRPDESAQLEFALGKAYDDLGEPERAIGHWDRANRIRHRLIEEVKPFSQGELAGRFAVHRELCPLPHAAESKPPTGKPIFVIGMMRSGTTLVEQLLSAHSQVVGAGELDFWPGSDSLLIDYAVPRTRTERIPERRATFLRLLASFGGENLRVVDKNPGNIVAAGLINRVFPDAAIIHLRRNPLDVALSLWMNDASAPFMASRANIVFAIRQAFRQGDHWRTVLPANRFLDLRYEDLVDDPETWTRRILEFCGLPWEDACLRADTTNRKINTPSVWQVRQPIYGSSVARWKRYEPWLGEFAELVELV